MRPDGSPSRSLFELWARTDEALHASATLPPEVFNALLTGLCRQQWDRAGADAAATNPTTGRTPIGGSRGEAGRGASMTLLDEIVQSARFVRVVRSARVERVTADRMDPTDPSGTLELPATQARHRMPELIALVQDGNFVYLTHRGRRVAALMPADIAEHYEQIEDEHWARRAAEAHDRLAARPEVAVPWEQVIAELEGSTGR